MVMIGVAFALKGMADNRLVEISFAIVYLFDLCHACGLMNKPERKRRCEASSRAEEGSGAKQTNGEQRENTAYKMNDVENVWAEVGRRNMRLRQGWSRRMVGVRDKRG